MTRVPSRAERRRFVPLNRFMVLMWRLGLGGWLNFWPAVLGRIMLLTQRGRRSGLARRTPLNYCIADDAVYVTAGFGEASDWYRNVQADPHVEVWLPEGWWEGEAEDVTDPAERLPRLREVLVASGFAARLAGVDPVGTSDAELDALTGHYRLVRIRRGAARTGVGGPGDLAWIWPTVVLLTVVGACMGGR